MLRIALLLYLLLILPGCSEVELASHVAKQVPIGDNQRAQQGKFKVGNPYEVAGRVYHPQERYTFTETGIASWYGPKFHGKKTANGETYNKYDLTAAHRTLQMPSLARVTNLENGRSIVVRINDRGPFKKDRVIDVSERASELLGFKNKGTARVKIEVLEIESRQVASIAKQGHDTRGIEVRHQNAYNKKTPPSAAPSQQPTSQTYASAGSYQPISAHTSFPRGNNFYVQAGAFGNRNNALAMAEKLRAFGNTKISETSINGNYLYRVRLGPYLDAPQANEASARLASANIQSPMIVVE